MKRPIPQLPAELHFMIAEFAIQDAVEFAFQMLEKDVVYPECVWIFATEDGFERESRPLGMDGEWQPRHQRSGDMSCGNCSLKAQQELHAVIVRLAVNQLWCEKLLKELKCKQDEADVERARCTERSVVLTGQRLPLEALDEDVEAELWEDLGDIVQVEIDLLRSIRAAE